MERYSLEINEEPQYMLRPSNDGYMMEIIYESHIQQQNWPAINRCRMYHRILTLSDKTTGTGNKIRSDIWDEKQCVEQDLRTDWPRQGQPSPGDWRIWQHCLMTLFQTRSRDSTIASQLQLGQGKVTKSWKWYFHLDTIF